MNIPANRKVQPLRKKAHSVSICALLFVLSLSALLSGCGSSGYPGGGIASLSSSSITMDAGQSVNITATIAQGETASWALSGASCSSSTCGTLSASTGADITYTAPSGLTAPLQVTLTAGIAHTSNSKTVSITVNPAPAISGTLPAGAVGTPYSATLTASGGTGTLTLSIASGTLPDGLTFNASNGTISGTPTTVGTSTFVVQVTDQSDATPDTVKVNETITVSSGGTTGNLSVTGGVQPAGTVGVAYTTTLTATGGTAPYTWSISSGTLPAGLTIAPSTGIISGTPTAAGSSNFVVQVADSTGATATASASITINNSTTTTLTLTSTTLPNGIVGVPYSGTIGVSGGTSPYSCAITSGTLPAGLTLTGCTVSGTPTTAGTSQVAVKVTDSASPANTASGPETIVISAASLTLTSTTLPNGTVGVPYTGTIGASGGTSPYSCAITSGTLPAGLTLTGCTVSGTPTTAGTSQVTVKVTDSASPANTASGPETIVIAPATLTLTSTTLPPGTVGVPYTGTIGASGGTAPYSCAITSGTLPAGLTISGCTVSGTPTTPGTSQVTVKVTDSASPANTASGPETIVISAANLVLTSTTLPNGTVGVAYSGTIGASGGTAPYSCVVTGGTPPPGLVLNGCAVSGIPTTAGTFNVTVKVTDAANPAKTATGPETIVISPAAMTLTGSTLPNGTVGVAYTGNVAISGGTAPYSCVVTGGTPPPGLVLNGCAVSGTPTSAGTFNVTVKATDSASPANTASGPETIVIAPATLTLSSTTLPPGTVGVPYTGTIGANGGISPYSCSITSGTLPAGLILNGCTVSGTPTTAGTSKVTVKVTDSATPADTGSGPETIVIAPAALTLTNSTLPNGTVGIPYSGTIGASGGTAPYSCSVTSGTPPPGLTLSGCTVSGTPTTAGTFQVTAKVTDSSTPANTASGPETIVIVPASLTITSTTLPTGTVGVPYTGTIGASGGTSPYNCAVTGGTLPAGLTLTGCTISGTPTTPGTSPFTVTVTDSGSPQKTASGPETITIEPSGTLSLTATLPNAILNTPYSYTLKATGGTPTYDYAVTAGALPAGITLSPDGILSGTPTAPGASSFTVTVTDTKSATATANLILLVTYPTSPNDSELSGPYAYLFQGYDDVVAGVLAYQTATVGSFTADGVGGITGGELDSNHQSSTPATTTVATQTFLATYIVNADSRGFITITTLNPDKTTAQTSTYAISLKAPVAPATIATQGSLIEYDNNQLVGTKGSGSLLAQIPATFAAGLKGSYAFGLSGDTPCLISCTIGIASGPVATVGQFTTDGAGAISGGSADANIASTNFANAPLNGSYGTADQNGRLTMQLNNTSISDGVYPTDYAVYIVNANEAFVMSIDKHSSYTLLSGTAQLQTTTAFDNSYLNGPFIGYENAQSDPGLVGSVLQSVLNFSTATVFRATGNGAGTCNTTNVDSAGLTALVDNLTGISGSNTLLQALLGNSTATGTSTCQIATNGRSELNYPQPPNLISALLAILGLPTGAPAPRIVYLTDYGTGYFLESGYAGLGHIELQTGAPYSLATLNGTFVYSSIPASSLASITQSGHFTANGAGQATTTLDANIGVGTLNILQLGATTTTTYALSNPNGNATPATAGRYLLGDGSTVIYAITPDRFVLLNTSPLTTSPSVSLLY
ncbi:beta strand repeat-containing protein [Silvibacterium acidisoli]|uniref:beta strand repeat-containing protein n=1 Tax=Acidobacteriaceae bacterium ZG23-2 TaxID=2883246 RepID=UPI00406D1548